jgi:OFA family oxalate/formate antiporter-like MFS transporter
VETSYQEVASDTGRVFRVGETPKQLLGYSRRVVIIAAWVAMCLSGLVEYTWGALSGSLAFAHNWGASPVFWLFSAFVICGSFVQIGTGLPRSNGILPVRWAVIIGGLVCGVMAYGLTAYSTALWEAHLGYAVLGGIGSGMVYSSAINQVVPEQEGLMDRVRQRRLGVRLGSVHHRHRGLQHRRGSGQSRCECSQAVHPSCKGRS